MSSIGFVGLGAMGGRMASRLLAHGMPVTAFDADGGKAAMLGREGAHPAADLGELARACRVVLLSLPSPQVAYDVATSLAGPLSPGSVVIDMGTMTPARTRDIAARCARIEIGFVDAPVTGGESGAADGGLTIFAGGAEASIDVAEPVLSVLGKVVRCGPSGAGQAMKVANQMCMGLVNAVMLEALAYGRNERLDPALMADAIGGPDGWRAHFTRIARLVSAGQGAQIGIKHAQLAYAIDGAAAADLTLPACSAAKAFCEDSPAVIREANRMSPSYWAELTKQKAQ